MLDLGGREDLAGAYVRDLVEEGGPLERRGGRREEQAGVGDEAVVDVEEERDGLRVAQDGEVTARHALESGGEVEKLSELADW